MEVLNLFFNFHLYKNLHVREENYSSFHFYNVLSCINQNLIYDFRWLSTEVSGQVHSERSARQEHMQMKEKTLLKPQGMESDEMHALLQDLFQEKCSKKYAIYSISIWL